MFWKNFLFLKSLPENNLFLLYNQSIYVDPDEMSQFDAGFISRQSMFCSEEEEKKKIGKLLN